MWHRYAWLLVLAGCASKVPAPVAERPAPARVEAATPVTAAPAAAAAASSERVHVVKRGETLFAIAREYGLNPRDLAAWNQIEDIHRLHVGQTLRLAPPAAVTVPPPTVAETEVRAVALGGPVSARPLDSAPVAVPAAAAPTSAESVKRSPKGGKLPYSEENLARLRGTTMAAAAPAAAPDRPAPDKTTTDKPATDKPSPDKPAAEKAKTDAAPPASASGIEWAWPASGRLIATFSESGAQGVNRGIDLDGRKGEPVFAAAAGKVTYVGPFPKYGNLVVIQHEGGYTTVYAHVSRILVKEAQTVKRGQKIAEIGDSDADRPKLHFELRHQGRPLDPLKLLPARG